MLHYFLRCDASSAATTAASDEVRQLVDEQVNDICMHACA